MDINDILELRRVNKDSSSLTIGGNVSLTKAMEAFHKYSENPEFGYLQHLAKHIDLIASVPVRNIGTLAGNLMIDQASTSRVPLGPLFDTGNSRSTVTHSGSGW